MAHNNDALYDAVVAGAGGGAQHGWLILSTPASYTPFANNIDILATAVDLQIPTIAGGASISQINLLQSITQSVLTARYPVPVAPATYIDIAKAIAAVYTELEKLLTNQPTVASYGVNWLVTDWYIDGTVGDDANSGVVIGAPIKTGAELLRRLGPYAMWPQSVTVHVLANGMTDALVLRGLMMVAGTHLDVVGTPTQLADAGTIATYLNFDHTVPRANEITATGIADWTPYRWRRVRLTNGATPNAVAWIACANPAGTGVQTARISRFTWSNPADISGIIATVNAVVGTAVVVESLPKVPAISLFVDGPLDYTVGPLLARRQFSIQSVDCKNVRIQSPAVASDDARGFVGWSRLQRIGIIGRQGNAAASSTPCGGSLFALDNPDAFGIQMLQEVMYGCLVGDGILSARTANLGSTQSEVLYQGAALTVQSCSTIFGKNLQWFDLVGATSQAITTIANAKFDLIAISGANNAGRGICIASPCIGRLASTLNLQGAVTNARLTSAPAIDLTLPQLAQPNDYAQKGTSLAMVGGTVTVTVPWYANTIQKVTATHAAFAGIPGILSVQQISTTQFTITSSSALDTSTVNWTISALGRNIFISTV